MQKTLESYFDRLWPLTRSLTGKGNRKTLEILSEIMPLKIKEIPSGKAVFDWTIPPEWNIREAYILDEHGNEIINFKNNNLHVLGYSIPIHQEISFDELAKHIYTLPDQPNLIPYRTSYYERRWGFCMTHDQYLSLDKNLKYTVHIDATLDDNGSMSYGDLIIPGESYEEVLLSTYICHPSMANDQLSGPLVTAMIYDNLKDKMLKHTYRFLVIPETIGSIAYLAEHGSHLKKKMVAGYIVAFVGDPGKYFYKQSRIGNALPDRAAQLVLDQTVGDYRLEEFFAHAGSDERQFCSPGFNLPVGSVMRTRYGMYKEYHTSGDNKDFISFAAMEASTNKYLEIIDLIEKNETYVNQLPYCEPQLGKRGLYPTLGSDTATAKQMAAMLWTINLADGTRDIIDIARRSGVNYKEILIAVEKLVDGGILKPKSNRSVQ